MGAPDNVKSSNLVRQLVISSIYAIAMAWVESSVVVYLRLVINSSTAIFPLKPLSPHLFRIEFVREFATIVMLAAVARLQSRRLRVNLAFFLYCFGIWDIFYYIWLKVMIGWPAGPLTWDVLFLIPVPWFGPVLSPSIVSALFIIGAIVILRLEEGGTPIHFTPMDWISGIVGALVIIGSYLWSLPAVVKTGHPKVYPWWLFAIGALVWVVMFTRRALLTRNGESRGAPTGGTGPSRGDPPAATASDGE